MTIHHKGRPVSPAHGNLRVDCGVRSLVWTTAWAGVTCPWCLGVPEDRGDLDLLDLWLVTPQENCVPRSVAF